MGLTPEELKKHELTQWFRLFKKEQDIEGQAYYFTGANMEEAQKNFEAAMAEVAESHPDIEMHQLQSFDRKSLLTYLTRVTPQADGTTGYTVFWGFNPTGSMAFAEPNLTNDLTRLGEVSVPAGLRPEFNYNEADGHWYMFGVDQDGNATQWFNTFRATQASLDQHWTEIAPIIPELPEWATEYTAHHGGIYEKDGDKQYYACDKQLTVNGEVRNIHVRLVEVDPKAKEWIPCYETIAELFVSRQLMTLMKLNQISKPEEAVWMIREGKTFETEQSDLKRLEAIVGKFVNEINTNVASDIMPKYSCYPIQQEQFSGMVISVRKRFAKEFPLDQSVIDGVNINYPHGYLILRRGQQDQLVVGIPSQNSESTIWLGYDQSVLTAALPDRGRFADPDTITVSNLVRYCQLIDNVRDVVSGGTYLEPNGLAKDEVAKIFSQEGLDPDYAKDFLNTALAQEADLSSYTSGHIFWLLGIEKS